MKKKTLKEKSQRMDLVTKGTFKMKTYKLQINATGKQLTLGWTKHIMASGISLPKSNPKR